MYKLVVLLSVACLAAGGVVPVAYSVPAVSSVSQYSSSIAHGSPFAYSAPLAYSTPLAYSPLLAQPPHSPAVVLDPVHGVPLDTPEVVAARAAHYQAKALSLHHLKKRSVAVAPMAYSSVVAPYSAPVVAPYSASVVAPYSASVVAPYSASVVAPYSASVVSPYASAYSPYAYSAPVVTSPLAYHGVVPKALSVHPY